MSGTNNPIETELPNTGYMRLDQVLQVIPVKKTTWWGWIKQGKAPKGIKWGARITVWKVSDIKKLIRELEKPEEFA